ncbi:putative DNA binding domain-containing protein [Bifidobacterium amazonense]|uniref:DNA binding domain-containing protein n=3 Tax=Bifidobacterium TaxID=1678 RepID=A0ABS6WCD8_9BIFI|nr:MULTISPECIES: ATP-binding protein [Bifidobacterium]KFI51596.1 putative transcriptional regulator [Bifidobacterium biavatii DSM 23969]MBW3091713.1 putative DNA binding domain-containing protein [Bifidobacterium miconis]MCH9274951.1 putative DNA binding domain-containing protein [Bifidobacterium amazonense]
MPEDYVALVIRLAQSVSETQTIEFKDSNARFEMIGRDIAALANSAVVEGQDYAYMVWGIDDSSHAVIGTSFNPLTAKRGNQELEIWLRVKLSDNAEFQFIPVEIDGKTVVVLRIWPAIGYPVSFDNVEYIRSGTSTQPLQKNTQREQRLWDLTRTGAFEDQIAMRWLSRDEVLSKLNWARYFTQTGIPLPEGGSGILHYLIADSIVKPLDSGQYAITNLGALLFAVKMDDFETVSRKAIRIIRYTGKDRLSATRSKTFPGGYADIDAILDYLQALLPEREEIDRGLRVTVQGYPELAIRELLGNMLIHQDLTVRGSGPLVEIFEDRVEFSNPGSSLIEVSRLVNDPPQSRNPKLAKLARRLNMCEEAGSGWDKIIRSCELMQLPAPEIQETRGDAPSMRVRLMQRRPYRNLTVAERMQACYWHACVQYANGDFLTNASLRMRFGLPATSSSQISRLISESIEAGLIRLADADAANKKRQYLPAWAGVSTAADIAQNLFA